MLTELKAVYFSATGTTRRIAETLLHCLAEELSLPAAVYDFTLPAARGNHPAFGPGCLAIVAVPVYAGRVPNVLLPWLRELRGEGALAVPVVLYGNRNPDDGLMELATLLESQGFALLGAASFVGEHAFSRVLGAGRPDASDLALARLFARRIASKLRKYPELSLPGLSIRGYWPLRPYYTPRDRAGNPVNILKVKPRVNEALCRRCGTCAAVCPMGSVDPEDVTHYTGICIKCGACEKACPAGARYFDDPGYLYHRSELEQGYIRRAEPELFL